MSKMYLADNVGSDGTIYPTVGEHIRKAGGSVTPTAIAGCVKDNTDRAKICIPLHVTAEDFKTALLNLLTGKTAYFGGLDIDEFSASELADIKAHLGIV